MKRLVLLLMIMVPWRQTEDPCTLADNEAPGQRKLTKVLFMKPIEISISVSRGPVAAPRIQLLTESPVEKEPSAGPYFGNAAQRHDSWDCTSTRSHEVFQ